MLLSFQKLSWNQALCLVLWLSNGKLLCITLHLRVESKYLGLMTSFSFTRPRLICKSHLTAVALWPTASLLSTRWQWKPVRRWACKELQTLLILDNMRNTNPCLLSSPFWNVLWVQQCVVAVPVSLSHCLPVLTKTSLPSHFFSPLQPASLKSAIDMCPPCPKVIPLSSIWPLKSPSPSLPKSIFPPFPPPSYFEMLKLVGLVPFTILAHCSTTRKSS